MKNYHITKEDTVFLFIDIQDKLVQSSFNSDEVYKKNIILAKLANIMNMPTISTLQYPKGLGQMTEKVFNEIKDTTIIDKVTFSAMLNEEFKEKLAATGRKKVVISGVETHICVLLTARDLIEEGYEVYIAKDAVGSRAQSNYLNGIDQMHDMGAVITNVETILFDLNSIAGTPEFKKVQKLII